MKKILVISDEYPPAGGGAGTIAKRMVLDLILEGMTVDLITGDNVADENGVRHFKVHRPTLFWVFNYWKTILNSDLKSYDRIILNDMVAGYVAGAFLGLVDLNRCTYVVHGTELKAIFQRRSFKRALYFYRVIFNRLLKHCGAVVCVSSQAKSDFFEALPADLFDRLSPRVFQKYAGVCRSDFRLASTISLDQRFLAAVTMRKTILLSVGRLVERKGYSKMIRLFADIKMRRPDIVWFVAGDGPYKNSIESELSCYGLNESIFLLGKIPRANLAGYYSQADIFWLLSPDEPFGLVYIEAAMFGLPSIGMRKGGALEAIIEGETGVFLDSDRLDDALDEVTRIKGRLVSDMGVVEKRFSTQEFARFIVSPDLHIHDWEA